MSKDNKSTAKSIAKLNNLLETEMSVLMTMLKIVNQTQSKNKELIQ